jgi:hypothetical protein
MGADVIISGAGCGRVDLAVEPARRQVPFLLIDKAARPTFVAALSVRVPSRHQGVLMGATQSLVAVTDIVTPVLAGLIVGQSLYGAWIACVVAVAVLGAVVARARLPTTGGSPSLLRGRRPVRR